MKKKLIELPKELFDQIEKEAEKEDRSVNKTITILLKEAVKVRLNTLNK